MQETTHKQFSRLVIEKDDTETLLLRRLADKEIVNEKILTKLDELRTENTDQYNYITHLEELVEFFIRQDSYRQEE